MKFFYLILITVITLPAWSKTHITRQWSRSALVQPHYNFRHTPKMAPLLTDNLVIQGNATDGIKAFDRNNGHEVWSLKLRNGVEGGAAIDQHRLFFGANDGKFYAVDVNSGAELWSFQTNSESLTRPLVKDTFVFHVSGNGTVYAFNKTTGQSLWVKTHVPKASMTVRGQTAPVWEKGVLYMGFSDGTFKAINGQTGRELWSKRIGDDKKFNDVDADPVITKSCVLVASYANSLYCLNKSSGAIRWRSEGGAYQPAAVINNKVYHPTASGEIHILDLDSGKLLKKITDIKGQASQVVEFGPYVLYGESEGGVVLRDLSTLKIFTRFDPGLGLGVRPTVDNKKKQIYFVSQDSNLFRLDLLDRPEDPFHWSEKHDSIK